jgi:threonine dehydrogenase-like Zn-dependent dehydrogenase
VGQFAIASAFMLGAARGIAIDRLPERLQLARNLGAIVVDYSEEDVSVLTAIKDLTGGVGPDACIDAVGLEAHSSELQGFYDKVRTALMMETDRSSVLRQAIQAVRKGGTLSIPGVYGGLLDKVPFGAAFGKGITMKMGQTNMHNYMKPLLRPQMKRLASMLRLRRPPARLRGEQGDKRADECWSELRRGKSIRVTSSPIASRSKRPRKCTKYGGIKRRTLPKS